MKVKISGKTNSKLAFVKLIKELTGMGLREAKEWCGEFFYEPTVQFKELEILDSAIRDIHYITPFDQIKGRIEETGMTCTQPREDNLAELLDNVYDSECKFIVISLGVKYKVVEGSYVMEGDFYKVYIEEGAREFEGNNSIYDKTITLPIQSTIIEE